MLRAPLVSTLIVVLLAVTGYADALLIRAPPTLQLGSATLTGAWGLLGAEAYRGIPFALPPTGERRFMPPVKAPPLIGRFDATRTPKACQQMLTQGGECAWVALVTRLLTRAPRSQRDWNAQPSDGYFDYVLQLAALQWYLRELRS